MPPAERSHSALSAQRSASKPHEASSVLCRVPSQNLDNPVATMPSLRACLQGKSNWTQATSRRDEGVDEYKIGYAQGPGAFTESTWPTQARGAIIDLQRPHRSGREDHPATVAA